MLVEISFSHVFARFWYQNYEKWGELKHLWGFFSNPGQHKINDLAHLNLGESTFSDTKLLSSRFLWNAIKHIFALFLLIFFIKILQKLKKADFDQHLECAAFKLWLKFATYTFGKAGPFPLYRDFPAISTNKKRKSKFKTLNILSSKKLYLTTLLLKTKWLPSCKT